MQDCFIKIYNIFIYFYIFYNKILLKNIILKILLKNKNMQDCIIS